MSWREDKASFLLWASALLLSLVTMVVGAVAWADHEQIGVVTGGMNELKAYRIDDHEAIQEMRQDVREIKNHILDSK